VHLGDIVNAEVVGAEHDLAVAKEWNAILPDRVARRDSNYKFECNQVGSQMDNLGKFTCVMAGLVPAIHAFIARSRRRGCPAQGRA
jgi:hypothetical protein